MSNKCNWCGRHIDNNFSSYCSKKCEKEAIESGEPKGIDIVKEKVGGCLSVVVLIFIVFFIYKCSNDNTELSPETSTGMTTIPNSDSISQENVEPSQSNESVNDNIDEAETTEIEEPPAYIDKGIANCVVDKSYFYNSSDYASVTNNYIINGDNINYYVLDDSSDFIYVIYTNNYSGKTLNGWMPKENFDVFR